MRVNDYAQYPRLPVVMVTAVLMMANRGSGRTGTQMREFLGILTHTLREVRAHARAGHYQHSVSGVCFHWDTLLDQYGFIDALAFTLVPMLALGLPDREPESYMYPVGTSEWKWGGENLERRLALIDHILNQLDAVIGAY